MSRATSEARERRPPHSISDSSKEVRTRAQPERLDVQMLIAPAHTYRRRITETHEEDTVVQKGKVNGMLVGQRVVAHYGVDDDEGWFDGVVGVVHADGRIDVQYDDGDSEERKDPARVLVTEAEGLKLHLSSNSATGYRGVYLSKGRYTCITSRRAMHYLGRFDTALEAAACYARHMQGDTASRRVDADSDSTESVTEAEGVKLHVSSRTASGYKGVYITNNGFKASRCVNGTLLHLGNFDTAVEAAISYARHVQAKRPATDEGGSEAKRAKSASLLETAAFYALHVLQQQSSAAAPAAASSTLAKDDPLPGWTVEERVTSAGRLYRVYHSDDGKHKGVRSRKAAWAAHTSLQEEAPAPAPSPPPGLTGMAEVRGLLAAASLSTYAEALEELGYDDLHYLQSLDRETLMSVAAEAGIVKPGHVARFRECVLGEAGRQ